MKVDSLTGFIMGRENSQPWTGRSYASPPQLRVTVVRALDLMRDGRRNLMKTFALLWIDPTDKKSTPVSAKVPGRFPEWNHELLFDLEEDRDLPPHSTITIEVWCVRASPTGSELVYFLLGSTHISLASLAVIKARSENPAVRDTLVAALRSPPYHRLQGCITLAISYTVSDHISQGWNTSCLARLLPNQRGPVKGFPVGGTDHPPAPYSEHDIPLGSRFELEVHFRAAQSRAGHGPNHPFSTYYLCTHWQCECRSRSATAYARIRPSTVVVAGRQDGILRAPRE